MKIILIGFFLINTAFSAECENWIAISELAKSQAGEAASSGCKSGEKCFCYEGVDLREVKIGMKYVGQKLVEGLIVDEAKRAGKIEKEEQEEFKRQEKQARKARHDDAMQEFLDILTLDDNGAPLLKDQIKANVKALRDVISKTKP